MAATGIVDPTKAGRYPVVLSDALLGKRSSEVYTGVRYNHRPEEAPESAKLRQNVTFKGSYDLIYGEKGGIHKYRGNRTNDGSQYVLIFDPQREVFVLHKVDSMFNMNLTQTPDNKNTESLKKQYPPLPNSGAEVASTKSKSGATSQGPKTQSKPEPKAAAAVPKRKNGSDDEASDEDDNGGLEIDFGNDTAAPNRDFSPAFPPRRFSEFAAENEEEEDDADGEDEDEEMSEQEHLPLPSPIVHQPTTLEAPVVPSNKISFSFEDDSASEEDEETAPPSAPVPHQQDQDQDDDIEDELEAALEAELGAESESDVSEED